MLWFMIQCIIGIASIVCSFRVIKIAIKALNKLLNLLEDKL